MWVRESAEVICGRSSTRVGHELGEGALQRNSTGVEGRGVGPPCFQEDLRLEALASTEANLDRLASTSSSSFFSVTRSQSPSTAFWLGRWSRLRFKSISTTRRRTRGALVPWPTSPSRRSIARLWHGLCEDNPLLGFLSLVCFVERGLMVGAGELDC